MTTSLRRASMRTQIFLLATIPLLLFALIAGVRAPLREMDHERREWARVAAGQITLLVDQIEASAPGAENAFLSQAVSLGPIRLGASSEPMIAVLSASASGSNANFKDLLVRLLIRMTYDRDANHQNLTAIGIILNDGRSLAWTPAMPPFSTMTAMLTAALVIIASILFPILLLTYYLSMKFARSISEFALAARQISIDENAITPFEVAGAAEIRSLGISLNVMRERIRRMLEERTRMLWGLSHDLRTPLTRLRMRAERVADQDLRVLMLNDIDKLSSMVDDGMLYLKGLSTSGTPSRNVDLTSLLQTICADYADVGANVSFSGPRRLAYKCRPQGITRAVANLIDNALRYASSVEVSLEQAPDGGVVIEVSDDGPGLPDELKWQAIEPFFKSDSARPSAQGGMGLGLPNAIGIVKAHGGSFSLLDRKPHGLIARILLPALVKSEARP